MDTRQVALDFLAEGFSVIPITPNANTPLIPRSPLRADNGGEAQ